MTFRVPYVDLASHHRALKQEILEAVERVLEHGQFVLGPEVGEFEHRIAELLGVPEVVGVNSGTDALALALRVRGIGPGDEVITVSHSFVATAAAIRLVGAEPVFVDVREDTMLLDPARLPEALTDRTRAVMPVHLSGFPCDMGAICAFCEEHRLELIEDCAQSLGALHRRRPVGTFGIGCFSLHPLKPLAACGDGGLIATGDQTEADELRQLRNLGLRDRDHCRWVSGNSRLDALQAAILLVKLDGLPKWLEARRAHATAYRESLAGRLLLPPEEGQDEPSYSSFVVRHHQRDRLVDSLRTLGVDVKVHYPLAIHQQEAFADLPPKQLPATEKVVGEILSLPISPELTVEQREHVVSTVDNALEALS